MIEFYETGVDIRDHCANGEVHLVLGGRCYEPDAEPDRLGAFYDSMDSFISSEQ